MRIPICVFWFRRDLRLRDHEGLKFALSKGLPVVAVYCHDESEETRPLGGASKWWLHHSLKALSEDMENLGSRLNLFNSSIIGTIDKLHEVFDIKYIVFSHNYDVKASNLTNALLDSKKYINIEIRAFNTTHLCEPSAILKQDNTPYRVYTPYAKALQKQIHLKGSDHLFDRLSNVALSPETKSLLEPLSLGLEALGLNKTITASGVDWATGFSKHTPGEKGAESRLATFMINGLRGYRDLRDRADLNHTSGLSPHLRFGEISPFRVWDEIEKAQASDDDKAKFKSEILWREFSYNLLAQAPNLHRENFNSRFNAFPWGNNSEHLRAWKEGRTGYDLVDAGMKELRQTGIMHNRVRMITASFLTKHLLLDWRLGEAYFWDNLLDADPANNPAGWQWVAGSGADAAPYFRIFNPMTAADKFDPDFRYRALYTTNPKASDSNQIDLFQNKDRVTGCEPIINHTFARERALAAFSTL